MSEKPDKPKGPKKRYTTKESIVAQIDKFAAKCREKHQASAQLLKDASDLRRIAGDKSGNWVAMLKDADRKQDKAQKLGKQVKRLEEKVLPLWKRKLSEFQTEVIPGFLPDNSVEEP